MKTISCWNDLQPFGLIPLTGEACGLMYRILFDCTEKGRSTIGRCLGIPKLMLAESWNRGSPDDPHVGSIMLSREMFVPLAVFALLGSGCLEVWLLDCGQVVGFDGEEHDAAHRDFLANRRKGTFAPRGTAGDRNVHVFTGRVE